MSAKLKPEKVDELQASRLKVGDTVYFVHNSKTATCPPQEFINELPDSEKKKFQDDQAPREFSHSWVQGVVETIDPKGLVKCKVTDKERQNTCKEHKYEYICCPRVGDDETILARFTDKINDDMTKDEDTADLLDLNLTEARLLRCLYRRYMKGECYTNIGAITVSLNPFTHPGPPYPRYADAAMDDFLRIPGRFDNNPKLPQMYPMVWGTAHNTYFQMLDPIKMPDEKTPQCILVSGESGAGKTVAANSMLKYLTKLSTLKATEIERGAAEILEKKLNKCGPLMECFGNAKTVRNDNSSRFGKFTKIQFDDRGMLRGAIMEQYLLEKSRVVTASTKERVYHSFYVVFFGTHAARLELEANTNYSMLKDNDGKGNIAVNYEFNTAKDFNEVIDSMQSLDMKEDAIKEVWNVVASILNLQNVVFTGDKDSASIEGSTDKYLTKAAQLLYVDKQELIAALTSNVLLIAGAPTISRYSVTSTRDARNALCKYLYGGVFEWIVDQCNVSCKGSGSDQYWIGLLDIFGFESFKLNSFEQLCINLTNETLQDHYNDYIFKKDEDEYKEQQLVMEGIVANPNESKTTIQLIKKFFHGLANPTENEIQYLGRFSTEMAQEPVLSTKFGKQLKYQNKFSIVHYAGEVEYTVDNWKEKNNGTMKDNLKTLIAGDDKSPGSKSPAGVIKLLLASKDDKGKKDQFVASAFVESMRKLMSQILDSTPHWVRCVKPHEAKKAKYFQGGATVTQLKSSGVLETIFIRQAGYPDRKPFQNFLDEYNCCCAVDSADPKTRITNILEGAGLSLDNKKLLQIGTTKVYLKKEASFKLNQYKEACLKESKETLRVVFESFIARDECFRKFVGIHRVELLQKKIAEEKKKREERAAEERERRRKAEEAERKAREEERKRKEEEARLEKLRKQKIATVQRYARGMFARLNFMRHTMEDRRAKVEHQREALLTEERRLARAIDTKRQQTEKAWLAFLNNVDHLKTKNSADKARQQKHDEQRMRIAKREIERKESEAREAFENEALYVLEGITTRWEMLKEHKRQLLKQEEQAKKIVLDKMSKPARVASPASTVTARKGSGLTSPAKAQPPPSAHPSARSDARTQELLTEYAVRRARAFDEFFPPPPQRTVFSAAAHVITDSAGVRTSHPVRTRGGHFDQAKNRWAEQEEFVDTAAQQLFSPYLSSGRAQTTYAASPSRIDEMYSGPHRTYETALQQSYQASVAPRDATDQEPPWMRQAATMSERRAAAPAAVASFAPTPTQRRALNSAVDWESVFNS